MSFSAEKQKAKQQQHIDINHSDLTDRTGHWIENQCLSYVSNVWDGCSDVHIKKLTVHKRAVKVLCAASPMLTERGHFS